MMTALQGREGYEHARVENARGADVVHVNEIGLAILIMGDVVALEGKVILRPGGAVVFTHGIA